MIKKLRARLLFKVLLIALPLCLLIAIIILVSFTNIVGNVVKDFSRELVLEQVEFAKLRSTHPLLDELAKAEIISSQPSLIAWGNTPNDETIKVTALKELDRTRQFYREKFFFFVNDQTLEYYAGGVPGKSEEDTKYWYTLNNNQAEHAWYFKTRELNEKCALNVDHDEVLAVTNVWINCRVIDDDNGRTVGIYGTGIELTSFIKDLAEKNDYGVELMALNLDGAIQIHKDFDKIDKRSITKSADEKNTIFDFLDQKQDEYKLKSAMQELMLNHDQNFSITVLMDDREYQIGLAYVPELKWFIAAKINLNQLVLGDNLTSLVTLLAGAMVLIALALFFTLSRIILRRLILLDRAVMDFSKNGEASVSNTLDQVSDDELGRLNRNFASLTRQVESHTKNLEGLVASRTNELEKLAQTDPLTGAFNRRAFKEKFDLEIERSVRYGSVLTVLILDIDWFKKCNDDYGHAAGDQVLIEISSLLQATLRDTDILARFGGEEFVILLPETPLNPGTTMAQRLCHAIQKHQIQLTDSHHISVTASFGVTSNEKDTTLSSDVLLKVADDLLYQAKASGRNQVASGYPK